jgi:hypothetical protein
MTVTAETNGIGQEQRKTLSITFLGLAWAIEIAAAGVGLTLAVARLQEGVGLQGILAALPFFAVAIMELTKIPLATVIYHTTAIRWRNGFAVALALSMVITFETFAIGFDTYQAELEKNIKPTVDAVKELKLQINSTDENIAASDVISKTTDQIDIIYKERVDSINEKYDRIVDAFEEEKRSIEQKYEGNTKSVQGIVAGLREQLADRNKQISAERKAQDREIKDLGQTSLRVESTKRKNIQSNIDRLQDERQQIRQDILKEKAQIRTKVKDEYEACQQADAKSFFGKKCDSLKIQEVTEIKEIDEKLSNELKIIQEEIRKQTEKLSITAFAADGVAETKVRDRYTKRIKKLEADKVEINKQIAVRMNEISRIQGNFTKSDKSTLNRLNKKIASSNNQRNAEQAEAKKVSDQRRNQADSAKKDVSVTTKQANELRKKLAPLCAKLNGVVSSNQVYRLAIQFHDVNDACDLTQEQLTRTQWIWYGSLALVVSALGTTLAFAGLVIKYPPSFSGKGGFLVIIKGLFRRLNYALAMLHRRLRKPVIKEVPVEKEVIKEVTKEVPVDRVVEKVVEVTKEVPVEKVVFRDVPREVVKKELIHVPLFTQDPKAVVKSD